MRTTKFWVKIALIAFFISILMFCWNIWDQFSIYNTIDVSRFSGFGSFIGGIFGTISVIILLFTFRETREQNFDNSFFNHLQLHDSLVRDLRFREKELERLNVECKNLFQDDLYKLVTEDLKEEYNNYKEFPDANDFFEILYRILHVRYKYENDKPEQFFSDNNWSIGHFLRSFISVVELVYENTLDHTKRSFYCRVIKSRSDSHELRLVFYYITFNKDENEKIRLARLFKSVNFFDDLTDPLIKSDDWNTYLEIPSN